MHTLQLISGATAVAAILSLSTMASAATFSGVLPDGWVAAGNAGSGTADGNVVAAPTASGNYTYVSTAGGSSGVGALDGVGGSGSPTNGSTLTTTSFFAAAGDTLQFFFNYVTSDGAGFADYAWAQLLNDDDTQAALLFTARTTPGGNTVPGFSMPDPAATLTPAVVTIVPGAPAWSGLGGSSGSCFDTGCGYTGWVESIYSIATEGTYKLQFGVTNWTDTAFQSGMAIAGANIGGTPIDPNDPVTPGVVPLPAAGWLLLMGMGGLGLASRRRRKALAS